MCKHVWKIVEKFHSRSVAYSEKNLKFAKSNLVFSYLT